MNEDGNKYVVEEKFNLNHRLFLQDLRLSIAPLLYF
jgi:hypothetical protein